MNTARRTSFFTWAAIGLALAALAVALVAWWALRTGGGALWLLGQLPGLKVEGVSGRLLGDLRIGRAELVLEGRQPGDTPGRVVVDDLRWQGLALAPAQGRGWLRLQADTLQAARVTVQPAVDAAPRPRQAPQSLVLPLQLRVQNVEVGELNVAGLADPLRELRASVEIGADGGQSHALEGLALRWRDLQFGGSLHVGADAPLATRIELSAEHPRWHAEARASGPIAALRTSLRLRGEADGAAPAPAADAEAVLRPFAPWPLGTLDARTRAFDLRALSPTLPATTIDADARVRSEAMDRPAAVSLALGNAAAGRIDEGRLPVSRLVLELQARPDDPRTLELQAFDADLGSTARPAGKLTGRGRWTPARWTLETTLADLQPDRLDRRAPALRVAGPLALEGSGFDSPAFEAARVALRGQLAGRLLVAGSPREASLTLDAAATRNAVSVTAAELRSGGARAKLAGALEREASAAAGWRAQGRVDLADFDPQPWWPGPADSPWRSGPHRLTAQGSFDLAISDAARADAARAARPLRWSALRGQATVNLAPSRLAGVGVTGRLALKNDGRGTALVDLQADADGNRATVQGRIDARADARNEGNSDHWEATLAAPAIARLAPALRLVSADLAAASGRIDADVTLDGRWPALRGAGRIDAQAVQVGALTLRRAQGSLQVSPQADAPLGLQLALTDAGWGGRLLDSAQVALTGTLRSHQLAVSASSRSLPPAWTDDLQGGAPAGPAARSTLKIDAHGGFFDEPGTPRAGWRGHLAEFVLGADNGRRWLATGDVDAAVRWAGGPLRVDVEPGRAELLGGTLRWQRIAWQDGAPPFLEARATLEPMAVAPVLRRLQPDFGWGGDLRIGARIELRSAPTFAADIVLERSAGDLTVTEETGTTALGLTDLRLGLNVADGTWSFTQGLAGSTLGVAAGAVVARTTPTALWPPADTPISGVVELGVANLGTWGPWVPAGWRLGGNLRMSASIGGRFGAPEYTGEVRGAGITVRNFAEGVAVGDGTLRVLLEGERARIETLSARAGDGTVQMRGEAVFGAAPVATLDLVADKFQLLGRVDRRIAASGTARLRLDRSTLGLDGAFQVDEGLIDFSRRDAPSLSDDVLVVRAPGAARPAGAAAAASAPARASPIAARVDLRVDLGRALRVRGRGLDTALRGDLRLTNNGPRMLVNGVVRAEDGQYAAYGQKLTIDRGVLTFAGAADNPRLEIEATRPNIDVRVGVAVAGTAQAPRIRLFSEPEMSEMDKLSWLVLGRASDGLGSAETALLQRAALALLAGEGEGFTDQFLGVIGLDEVSVRRSDGEVRETVVSLGKQLGRRWYVGYERSLNETVGTWQLVYRIAQRFTLRAQSGLDNSLDAIWTWRW
jgi:translocation and assembly module TamB